MENERKLENEEIKEESKEIKEESKEESQVMWLPTFMCLGLSIGMCFGGLLFDNMSMGMCIGISLGVAVGSIMDAKNRANNQSGPDEKEE